MLVFRKFDGNFILAGLIFRFLIGPNAPLSYNVLNFIVLVRFSNFQLQLLMKGNHSQFSI